MAIPLDNNKERSITDLPELPFDSTNFVLIAESDGTTGRGQLKPLIDEMEVIRNATIEASEEAEQAKTAAQATLNSITGAATPSTVPNASAYQRWAVSTAGTYTNFTNGGDPVVITSVDLGLGAVYIEGGDGTFKKLIIPLTANYSNTLFKEPAVNSTVKKFLLDIRFEGLVVNDTDLVNVYWIYRNSPVNPGDPESWIVAIAVNLGRVCQFKAEGYIEPAADAAGNRIATLSLTPISASGVTATARVNWSAIPNATALFFNTEPNKSFSALAESTYRRNLNGSDIVALQASVSLMVPKTSNLDSSGKLPSSSVKSGTGIGTVAADLDRIDSSELFKGPDIENVLTKFLTSIKFTGLTVSDSDQVNIHYIYRNLPVSGGIPSNIVAIAVNGTRVCQFKSDNYVEPAADAAGNRFDTISLTPIAPSTVTAIAIVNWSVITSASGKFYDTPSNRTRSLLSPKTYLPKYDKISSANVTRGLSTVDAELNRLDDSLIFKGAEIESFLPNFLLDVEFEGLSVASTSPIHLYFIYRNQPPSAGADPRWLLAFANNDARFCQWSVDNYSEPAADAAGNRLDTIQIPQFNSSGVTAKVRVNWAALPANLFRQYSGANIPKALIAPKIWKPKLPKAAVPVKQNLPVTSQPRNIYTVLNDIDPRNVVPGSPGPLRQDLVRQYSVPMYVDRYLRNFPQNTDVSFSETGTDKIMITSPRKNDNDVPGYDHPTPSVKTSKSAIISGGTSYNNKTVSYYHASTRESTGPDALVSCITLGDSTVEGLQAEVGSKTGMAARAWAVIQEQYVKAKIDFLLSQGVSVADIQSGSHVFGNKYRYFSVGAANKETWTLDYRGVTGAYNAFGEGRGGWAYHHYINKPVLAQRVQGAWDAIGLGNGTGTDYTGTTAQQYLYDRTAWNPNACIDTPAMRAWMLSAFNYTGSTLADYKAKLTDLGENPQNSFYDAASSATYTDANGNVWQVRFSIAKYLSRYRTMDDTGNRLANGAPTVGTKITNTADFDIFKPTHIIIQLCCNDGNVAHFGHMAKAMTETIKAEYAANSWGTVNIGLAINDSAGTYFTNRYPEHGGLAIMDEVLRGVYDDNLARTQSVIGSEETNRVFVLPGTHTTPTAKAIISRTANSPEYELTGDIRDTYYVPSRTSIGILIHPNVVANRVWGISHYAWIKYTLGL